MGRFSRDITKRQTQGLASGSRDDTVLSLAPGREGGVGGEEKRALENMIEL